MFGLMTLRLDLLVSRRFGLSRRSGHEAVLNGRVDLDGNRCDEPGRMVPEDARVDYIPDRPKLRRVNTKLVVLHEDAHLLIADKPAGLLTLPTERGEDDTLLSRVQSYLEIRHGGRPFVGIAHRLDRETSGALAFGRSPEAVRAFQALFRAHDVERQYLAVVEGAVPHQSGSIDLPLAEIPGQIRRRVARSEDEGRPAVTHYRVLERFGKVATLLACWLETGRTHQIRIHLASQGHPVLGDAVYRPKRQRRCKASFHRQALHAQTLGFLHPFTKAAIRVEALVPDDLAALIKDLRNRYAT